MNFHGKYHQGGIDANSQKLVTARSFTENYRQCYSIKTVRDWNALPQSVVRFFSTVQEPADPTHLTAGVQLVGVMLQAGALPTNCPDLCADAELMLHSAVVVITVSSSSGHVIVVRFTFLLVNTTRQLIPF